MAGVVAEGRVLDSPLGLGWACAGGGWSGAPSGSAAPSSGRGSTGCWRSGGACILHVPRTAGSRAAVEGHAPVCVWPSVWALALVPVAVYSPTGRSGSPARPPPTRARTRSPACSTSRARCWRSTNAASAQPRESSPGRGRWRGCADALLLRGRRRHRLRRDAVRQRRPRQSGSPARWWPALPVLGLPPATPSTGSAGHHSAGEPMSMTALTHCVSPQPVTPSPA